MRSNLEPIKVGYGIFLHALCEGVTPAWYDERGLPVIYDSEREAHREIAEHSIERLNQFLADERDFDDAITVEEFVLPLQIWPDRTVSTDGGRYVSNR